METNSRSRKTILIVDDETEIREVLTSVIGLDPQYIVQSVTNGAEALEVIKQIKVDVLITDLAMPKMNGFELLRRLKVMGKKIPTIVLTGHGDKNVVHQLKNYGVSDFLNKPWNNDTLMDSVQRLIIENMEIQKVS
jgi:YesN/AraC family two-component response regulator